MFICEPATHDASVKRRQENADRLVGDIQPVGIVRRLFKEISLQRRADYRGGGTVVYSWNHGLQVRENTELSFRDCDSPTALYPIGTDADALAGKELLSIA